MEQLLVKQLPKDSTKQVGVMCVFVYVSVCMVVLREDKDVLVRLGMGMAMCFISRQHALQNTAGRSASVD